MSTLALRLRHVDAVLLNSTAHHIRCGFSLSLFSGAHTVTRVHADALQAHPVIVHSPVRWDDDTLRWRPFFVQLAANRELLFVEDALILHDVQRPQLQVTSLSARLHRIVPRLPARYQDHHTATMTCVRTLLLELIRCSALLVSPFESPVQWFCTPMPAPVMIGAFNERAVVYDRRLWSPWGARATATMLHHERVLLGRSDLVLSGHESPDAIVPLLNAAVAARHTHSSASRVTRFTDKRYGRSSSIPVL